MMSMQTNLSIINFTPYDWTGYVLSETTGLIEWDFPKTLASGRRHIFTFMTMPLTKMK